MDILPILGLAAAMVAGLLLTRLAKLVHLPNVTAYLVAGLVVGPCCIKLMTTELLSGLDVILSAALGFIAFSIGGEFKLSHVRAIGTKALIITVCQAFGAVILVDAALILCGFDVPLSITLGAIATATAPAATLMVVRQYKAKGEVTSTLLPVVAMDDAIGLMVFSISIAVASTLSGGGGINIVSTFLKPMLEIVLSLVLGAALGFLLALSMKLFHSASNRLCVCVAAVLLAVGLADQFALSDLLVCMALGAMFVNVSDVSLNLLEAMDGWTAPLFLLFFVISGANLDLSVLPSVGLLGSVYILARSIGKYGGAWLGSAVTHSSPNIRKYLGLTLLPQAGVAIGMAQMAVTGLPEYSSEILAVVLCATLIYELVGPVFTKIALTKAGEIEKQPRLKKHKPNAA